MGYFDEAKATQVAAMILKLRGGRMHYIKLIKLLYLVDRASLLRWGTIVTTDQHVSMDQGPVGSNLYRLITEEARNVPFWSQYISAPLGEFEVALKTQDIPRDRLSNAEEHLIEEIYERYGYRNRWDIIDNVMHKLPEWQNPEGTSIPIRIEDILEPEGETPEEINTIKRELRMMSKSAF